MHVGTLDVWYTGWYTTPVATLSGFWYLRIVLVIFSTFSTIFTFDTPVAFGALTLASVFITIGIPVSFDTSCALWYT